MAYTGPRPWIESSPRDLINMAQARLTERGAKAEDRAIANAMLAAAQVLATREQTTALERLAARLPYEP